MKTEKIIIDGIIHKKALKKGKFGWYDLPICTRKKFEGIVKKYFRKVHVVITVRELK